MSDLSPAIFNGIPTRREFLYRTAAIGGLGLTMATMSAWGMGIDSTADKPPALTGSGNGKKVLILGAGLAGMTAAFELGKQGYSCEIVEARGFAGGRCQTARRGFELTELGGEKQVCDFDTGEYINHGPWRIPYNHRSTLHYTKEFDIPLEVFVNDNDAAYVYFDKAGALSGKRMRQGEIKADMRGHVAELLSKTVQDGKLDAQLSSEDKVLLLEYLANEGYLSKGDLKYVGTAGRGYKVNPGAGTTPGAGTPSDPLGFKELLGSKLGKIYKSVQSFTQQTTMFQPIGGMDQIAKGFAKHVGKQIRYNTEVLNIRQNDKGVTAQVKDTVTGKERAISADFCVCTIPLSVLKNIDTDFSPKFKAAIAAVSYEPVGKIGIQMKRRFWEEDDAIYGGHIRTDFKGVGNISLPSTNWQGKKGVLLGYYNFLANAVEVSSMPPAERAKFAIAAGQKVFPQYAENAEKSFSVAWHLVKYSMGGWADWDAESRKTAYPLLLEPEGRVYLAGEHLSYLTGWIAGAIESSWQQIAKLHVRATAG